VIAAFIYLTESLGSRMYPAGGAPGGRLVMPVAGALFTGYLLSRYFPNARGSGIRRPRLRCSSRDGFHQLSDRGREFFCCSVSLATGMRAGRRRPRRCMVGWAWHRSCGGGWTGPERRSGRWVPSELPRPAAAFNTPVAAVPFHARGMMGDLHAPCWVPSC